MRNSRVMPALLLGLGILAPSPCPAGEPAGLIELNDNGAWSWFMDERAIVDGDKLIVGSVRAVGTFQSGQSDPDWGNVEIAVLDIPTGAVKKTVLHRHFEQDDHDGPALLRLKDGRILAVYTKHGVDRLIHYRFSEPGDPLRWGPDATFESPVRDPKSPRGDTVTYSNLFPMPNGRIYNYYRGVHHDPNYMYSDDSGRTWTYGGHVFQGKGGYSPYLKYAFDGKDTIYFANTEDHPRNFDNSIYSGYVRDGRIFLPDGTPKAALSTTVEPSLNAWDLAKVFPGGPDDVAWIVDMEIDRDHHPYIAFSVQKDGRGLKPGRGGMDHRYYYGRWDGARWRVHEMAYAGTRLYPGEDDYTGLVALDPKSPDVVYISTDADPVSGSPLVSQADGQRHRELFRGRTGDGGATWRWEPITADSTVDNLRPIIPKWDDPRTALLWLRGGYKNNHGEWTTRVVALILPGSGK